MDIAGAFNEKTYFGLTFSIPSSDYYATQTSAGAEMLYQHDWVTGGRFGIQISFRAEPILPVRKVPLLPERYFEWLGIELPGIPSLDVHEIIGEKVRAAAQRNRVRDLFDLYQFATHQFDRPTVRKIAVIKCWETNFAFDPETFLESLREGNFDWLDLRRLVRRGWDIRPEEIIQQVQDGFGFLSDLTPEEAILAADPYRRQDEVYRALVEGLRSIYDG